MSIDARREEIKGGAARWCEGTYRMIPDVLAMSSISDNAVRVWWALCFLARPGHTLDHTDEQIARAVGKSRRTAQRGLAELEAAGFVASTTAAGRRTLTLQPDGDGRELPGHVLRLVATRA